MKIFYSTIFIALLAIIVFQGSACKGPQPCKALITVMDSVGAHPQQGVAVHLYAKVTYNGMNYPGDLVADATTDANGQASFTIKNPCILDIRATVPSCTVSANNHKYCLGTGIIRFDAGLTNTKTVNINQ